MRRRVYQITPKRKRIIDDALKTVRETRQAIGPELLGQARESIGNALEQKEKTAFRPVRPMQAERVPVDQKKNLTTVMKLLELKPDNKALHREILTFLAQN